MQTEIKVKAGKDGQTRMALLLPATEASIVVSAIQRMLSFNGHEVRYVELAEDEEFTPQEDLRAQARAFKKQVLRAEASLTPTAQGRILRLLRRQKAWYQRDLAKKLGTKQTCISKLETGKRPMSAKMAKRLAKAFAVSEAIFLDAEDNEDV